MSTEKFIYYGYDKETYYDCIGLIRSTNRKHITILNTWFLAVNLLYLIFSFLNLFGVTQERIPFYACYLVASAAFEICLVFLPYFSERHAALMVFISSVLMLSYGILASVGQPYMPATIYPVLFSLVAVSYIDTMARECLFSLLSMGIFLLTSFLFKTFSIAYHDTYNAAIILTLALGLHYTFQRTRIQQFILYQRDLQIQRELEVKSSFDALTTLLNRGRFFSITEDILRMHTNEYMTICLLDLDGFKQINDSLGHQMGDKVIQVVGKTMLQTLGLDGPERTNISLWDLKSPRSCAGRLGGDEFIALIRGKKSRAEIVELLQAMLDALNSVHFDGIDGIHASFGVTELNTGDLDIDSAYKRADEALYKSKRAGKNQIHFSEEDYAV